MSIDSLKVKSSFFLQRGLADSVEIVKDAELEAAAQAAAGVELGKKPQKGGAESALTKKAPSVPAGKGGDKQVAVRI